MWRVPIVDGMHRPWSYMKSRRFLTTSSKTTIKLPTMFFVMIMGIRLSGMNSKRSFSKK